MMQPVVSGSASSYKGSTNGKMTIRQFNTSQYDFPGSKTSCTAIACVAAQRFLAQRGKYQQCLYTNDHVMEVIAQGVVWHSRWLAAGDGTRSPYSQDELDTMSKLSLVSSSLSLDVPSTDGLPKNASSDSLASGGTSMAAPDEICALDGMPLKATTQCYAGYLTSGCAFGHTIEQSVRLIFSEDETSRADWLADSTGVGGKDSPKEPRRNVQAFVLTTKGYSTMIGRVGKMAVVFDSHKRSFADGLAYVNKSMGHAILVVCQDADTLIRYLKALYAVTGGGALYTLQEVELANEEMLSEVSEDEEEVDIGLGAFSKRFKRVLYPALWGQSAASSGSATAATATTSAASATKLAAGYLSGPGRGIMA